MVIVLSVTGDCILCNLFTCRQQLHILLSFWSQHGKPVCACCKQHVFCRCTCYGTTAIDDTQTHFSTAHIQMTAVQLLGVDKQYNVLTRQLQQLTTSRWQATALTCDRAVLKAWTWCMRPQPEQSSHSSLVQLMSTRRVRDTHPFTFSLVSSGSRSKLSSTSVQQRCCTTLVSLTLLAASRMAYIYIWSLKSLRSRSKFNKGSMYPASKHTVWNSLVR